MAWPHPERRVYRGEALRAVAMPLGGLGTGSVALCGDGSLRQWQIVNQVNHLAFVPDSFFGLWVRRGGGPPVAKVLMSPSPPEEGFQPAPLVTDHWVPEELRQMKAMLPLVAETEFVGEYPIAEVFYRDPALPLEVHLEAFSPFVPLNAKDSGLPAILFLFHLRNPSEPRAEVALLATLQNIVGWDGVALIRGVQCPGFGGNWNRAVRLRRLTAIEMSTSSHPSSSPRWGSLCLATLVEGANVLARWEDRAILWSDFAQDGGVQEEDDGPPSEPWRTWNGAIVVRTSLGPGEETTLPFVLTWFFPNRIADWRQPGNTVPDTRSIFWLGNQYARWFPGALAVAEYLRDEYERLVEETRRFRRAFFDSTLPYPLLEAVSAQMSIPRSPTCFWTAEGKFYGFEGCRGASAGGPQATGGCCPLNCTHVWNYEQTLAALFPEVERTMRETDLLVQLRPDGSLPHRTVVPLYLPRPWGDIGGPQHHALDGMLGTVLKTYREHRRTLDSSWLRSLWEPLKRLMEYILRTFDPQSEGMIRGEQPNTYDIHTYGSNTFIGTLYLAALRAMEEMANLMAQEDPEAKGWAWRYRELFRRGSQRYDEELWNGEYWVNAYDAPNASEEVYNQRNCWGPGCHSDQLLGQWWARLLDLGDLLPSEHIRQALKSIVHYNFREDFRGFRQGPRTYLAEEEAGLLNCSWPHGGRPEQPILYCDEVWTGIEYEVAALLISEGEVEEALRLLEAVARRHDGRTRSPWNHIECGDHYVRAMSSWSLLEMALGFACDGPSRFLGFAPTWGPEDVRAFFITPTGWGQFEQRVAEGVQEVRLCPLWGHVEVQTLRLRRHLPTQPTDRVEVRLGGLTRAPSVVYNEGEVWLRFPETMRIAAGEMLSVLIG